MRTASCLLILLALSTTEGAAEPGQRHVEKYASRVFLADGRVVDAVGAQTLAVPSGETSDVVTLRMPSGRILRASSRSEPVWETFEVQVSSGDVSLVLKGTMGFASEKLPDGLMLRLKETTYRWLAHATLPDRGASGSGARKRMQAAVGKLPQEFLSDLALFAALPAAGLDTAVYSASHLYLVLAELMPEDLTPVNVTTTQPLEQDVASRLLEGK